MADLTVTAGFEKAKNLQIKMHSTHLMLRKESVVVRLRHDLLHARHKAVGHRCASVGGVVDYVEESPLLCHGEAVNCGKLRVVPTTLTTTTPVNIAQPEPPP